MRAGLSSIKRDARRLLDAALAPRAGACASDGTRPTIVGLFGAASGIGESARLCFDAAQRMGMEPDAIDLSPGFRQNELSATRFAPVEDGRNGPLIIHVNPPELPRALRQIGAKRLRDRRVIGYWAWELPAAPASWIRAMRYVHEVWVPSTFCASSLIAGTDTPVRVVPHVIPDDPDQHTQAGDTDRTFHVIASGDVRSSLARKNIAGAADAFRQAFGDAPGVHLSIRVGHIADASPTLKELVRNLARSSNISIAERLFDEADEAAFIASADVVLSLHRSEGFGLNLAKAMRIGRPVVATAWSGNMDFMTPESACLVGYDLVPVEDRQRIYRDQQWAEPHIAEAAAWLKQLRNDAIFYAKTAKTAQELYPAEQSVAALRDAIENPAKPSEPRI